MLQCGAESDGLLLARPDAPGPNHPVPRGDCEVYMGKGEGTKGWVRHLNLAAVARELPPEHWPRVYVDRAEWEKAGMGLPRHPLTGRWSGGADVGVAGRQASESNA